MQINVIQSSSKGNACLISDEETNILIDCGIPLKKIQQAINYKLTDIDGCIGTHAHKDHLGYAEKLAERGVDCYMLKESAEHLGLKGHRIKQIKSLSYFSVGSWSILPFSVEHDIENVGYLLESKYQYKLCFLVDTPYCKYKFRDLTHIMIGCNYDKDIAKHGDKDKYNRVLNCHMNIEQACEFIRINKSKALKQIYLLHLSDSNSDERKFKKAIQKVAGKKVEVIVA